MCLKPLAFLLVMFAFLPRYSLALSCREYTDHLQQGKLHQIVPSPISEEESCRLIPESCGPSWLLLNPQGMQTYYYKSQCFYDLAIKTLQEKYCDSVIESKSMFFNGSYFTPDLCRHKIQEMQADQAARKVPPDSTHRIQSSHATIKDEELFIDIELTKADIAGEYALNISARYQDQNGILTFGPLNPEGANIRYDTSFTRFHPVNNWIAPISREQKNLTFKIPKHMFAQTFEAMKKGAQVTLETELQFIRGKEAIADPAKQAAYISKNISDLHL